MGLSRQNGQRRHINEIVHGIRASSADTALRRARFFGTSAQLWLNLHARYDLETERDRLDGDTALATTAC